MRFRALHDATEIGAGNAEVEFLPAKAELDAISKRGKLLGEPNCEGRPVRKMLQFSVVALTLLLFAVAIHAQPAPESLRGEYVRVFWIAPDTFTAQTEWVALGFELDPGWHVYWKNPGDSGSSPKIQLKAEGATLSDLYWPTPKRFVVGDLINFVYEGPIAGVLFKVTRAAESKNIDITADIEWLVCTADECVPGRGRLALSRKIATSSTDQKRIALEETATSKILKRLVESIPKPDSDKVDVRGATPPRLLYWELSSNGEVKLAYESKDQQALRGSELFPVAGEWLSPAAPQRIETSLSTGYFSFKAIAGSKAPAFADLVMTFPEREDRNAWEFRNIPFKSASLESVALTTKQSEPDIFSFLLLVLSAILGGALLNLMPCVFPVLSIKAMSLIKSHPKRAVRLRESLLYTAGTVVTFAALGGAVLALRAGGSLVGWGFQLQSPWVILGLSTLFYLMALNFLGLFEIGTRIMNWAGQHYAVGSFLSGILAVFVAAPCTGPFMGAALGAAVTLSGVESMTLFVSLGLGLALPYVMLSLSQRLLSMLPKPGPWMVRLKEFMAFLLFATVLWLLWVLAAQLGADAWFYALIIFLGIALGLWIAKGETRRRWQKLSGVLVAVVTLIFGVMEFNALIMQNASQANTLQSENSSTSIWVPFDKDTEAQIAQKRRDGYSVLVDYTAAWCVTCQWNKKAVLSKDEAMALFVRNKTWLVRADWTKEDPLITKSLALFGRNSVPLYVFYPPTGEPKILPQILTQSILEEMYVDKNKGE